MQIILCTKPEITLTWASGYYIPEYEEIHINETGRVTNRCIVDPGICTSDSPLMSSVLAVWNQLHPIGRNFEIWIKTSNFYRVQ